MPMVLIVLTFLLWGVPGAAQTTGALKASPAVMTFTYTIGDAKLPAPATLNIITGAAAGTPFTTSVSGGPWLTLTPAGGITPVTSKVNANPTTLAVGAYTGTITLTATNGTGQTASVAVTLSVKAPPPTVTATPSTLNFTYTRGQAVPAAQQMVLTTSGGPISYSVKVGGGSWGAATPLSGVVFTGFGSALNFAVTPVGLAPGAYKATVTVNVPQAASKTVTATVNLTVNPGVPAISAVWPNQIKVGSPATTITLRGTNFFSGTTVKAGATQLTVTVLGPDVINAVLPASSLATAGTLALEATNPSPGGGVSPTTNFTVSAAGPIVSALVDAASYGTGSIAPGEMVILFGSGLGPDTLATFIPPTGTNPIATSLAGTRVLFDATAAPVIYTLERQVAVMVPYDVAPKATVQVRAEYQGQQSAAVTLNVAPSRPALFTSAATGSGQAAALHYDDKTATYVINSEAAAAPKGAIVVLYGTGEGITIPASTDGQIITQVAPAPNPALSLTIGGKTAAIQYAGGMIGLVAGIIQINATIPTDVTVGKAVPVVLTVNGIQSPAGVTIAVK